MDHRLDTDVRVAGDAPIVASSVVLLAHVPEDHLVDLFETRHAP
jgi:hypothetical protein